MGHLQGDFAYYGGLEFCLEVSGSVQTVCDIFLTLLLALLHLC